MNKVVIKISEERCTSCDAIIPEGRWDCPRCENLKHNYKSMSITVNLSKISDANEFVMLAGKCKDDVVVKSGNFAVNGKSIMGLYSLDLSKPLLVEAYGEIPHEVKEEMKKFIAN